MALENFIRQTGRWDTFVKSFKTTWFACCAKQVANLRKRSVQRGHRDHDQADHRGNSCNHYETVPHATSTQQLGSELASRFFPKPTHAEQRRVHGNSSARLDPAVSGLHCVWSDPQQGGHLPAATRSH